MPQLWWASSRLAAAVGRLGWLNAGRRQPMIVGDSDSRAITRRAGAGLVDRGAEDGLAVLAAEGRGKAEVLTTMILTTVTDPTQRPAEDLVPPASVEAVNRPARGLVVVADPDEAWRWLLAFTLCEHGYEVLAASDGPTALALIQQYRPGLAVLAGALPGLHPLDLSAALRADPATRPIPLLVLATQRQLAKDHPELHEPGITCLLRPVTAQAVGDAVRRLLASPPPARLA